MKLRYLKHSAVEKLKKKLEESGVASWNTDEFNIAEVLGEDYFRVAKSIEIDDDLATEIKLPSSKKSMDAANSKTVFHALCELTPQQATDQRIWLYLTHCELWRYARVRWPMPKKPKKPDQAKKHIHTHYFVSGANRGLVRGNAISRLWWMGWIANRCTLGIDLSLKILLYSSDVRASIVERPSLFASETIFEGVMQALHISFKGDLDLFERNVFRARVKNLNRVGGSKVLEMLGSDYIRDILLEKVELP